MDLSLLPQIAIQCLLGASAIVFTELVRDAYHIAGHYWQPLKRGHNLHHKAYRPDLTITSLEMYQKAQLNNDVPEAIAMLGAAAILAACTQLPVLWIGCLYSLVFLIPAVARSQGLLLQTDVTHKPGDLIELPKPWIVNRTYHWRHHFDDQNAYYCGHFTIVDKLLGTSLALKGKTVAITGASGALGQALIAELSKHGAKVVALTTSDRAFAEGIEVLHWQIGAEEELRSRLQKVDIFILNHGVNVYGDRTPAAIQTSYEVNTFSTWRLAELFLETVTESSHKALKELWINTSEAEVNPALSPLYELSKRALGDLITLRRLDAPCIIRKLVLGPFKSQLNPYGVMSASGVAWAIVALAKRDFRDIIVTINPITYILFPIKEFFQSLYFRLFSK
ncbi:MULTISPECIES: bifunctional sterol desaturase/short chain dehydrogenase [Leptolyngbya]|uniref:bifunctional sterol desaturase/short chain dehydrogenase n=1 Tax=Leptolyngbya TaxID=47251 RepID=UPI001685991F|nr:bifunctional sterol desaturase/short chain dehydrogenase [Leptolyngbya sp. FACHB-1624]MBD1858127.1 bifunctional sterol desaturase/short chain dehydrogenase [Leptolyngbya sp. FACHB-1624]